MAQMNTLSIDIETYSDIDLKKCGVYRYASSPNADLLLFGYSIDNGPVEVIDVAQGEKIPEYILKALSDNGVTKWAYNSNFERVFLSVWLKRNYPEYFRSYSIEEDTVGDYLDPSSWRCSLVWGAYMGLPLSLKGIGAVLKLDEQKMSEGSDLIRYFCIPCKPTKVNGRRTRNLPFHAPDKWETFKAYNKRDVEVELSIKEKLKNFPVPEFVWDEYHLDQEINDRGIGIDMQLVRNAIIFDEKSKGSISGQMKAMTDLENPNSVVQMKAWLSENGVETDTLGKKAVDALMKDAPDGICDVLELRQQLAKSSVKKYQAMANAVCDDGRARGMFQFYGANRSGRWAGRLIQLQNLPRNEMSDLAQARELVRQGDYDSLEMLYDDIPDTLSQLIRTAFIPKPGYKFYVADFSAIEARVIACLAGETWRNELFAKGGDIYCQSASQMFKVPVEKHGVNGHLRQKGKIAELACIAEGSLVLTDKGLIPIEKLTTQMKVWDGESWVEHDGVIFKGEREVIKYEGLTATPDHLVWVEGKQEPIQFGIAASCGAHLVKTGDGGNPIRLGENHQSRKTMEQELEPLLCSDRVPELRNDSVAAFGQPEKRKVKRLSGMLPTKTNSNMAGKKTYCSKTTMRESFGSKLSKLWGKRNQILFYIRSGCRSVLDKRIWSSRQVFGTGQNRYERRLCSREPALCLATGEPCKPAQDRPVGILAGILALFLPRCSQKTLPRHDKRRDYRGRRESSDGKKKKLAHNISTARLYDIRNAGPHHRFTVSDRLVHNCGYGGSVGALKAMGALEMGLQEEELQPLVDAWRTANPNIVQLWWDVDEAVKTFFKNTATTETHGLKFIWKSGMLFIELPSKRRLCYVKPRIGENRFGGESVTYEGIGATKKWERLESYGPKFVENIVQAISRDLLMNAMKTLSHCFICGHVHDELIIESKPEVSLDELCRQMARVPEWMQGLKLDAAGYVTPWYCKD